MKRVGIMGGTFNPIHIGHLIMAQAAYEQYQLDMVCFMPNKIPGHKEHAHLATEQERAEMISLAIADNPHFALSTMEYDREGKTYTVDTLRILKEQHPDWELFFIMGADSLFHFSTWKEPEEILTMTQILVATRENMNDVAIESQIEFLRDLYGDAPISGIVSPDIQISSHDIRKRRRAGKSIQYMVSDSVFQYICEHKLYLV